MRQTVVIEFDDKEIRKMLFEKAEASVKGQNVGGSETVILVSNVAGTSTPDSKPLTAGNITCRVTFNGKAG